MDLQLIMDKTWLPQVHLYPYFLARVFAPNLYKTCGVSIHYHCSHVNRHQIEWPRWIWAWNQDPNWGHTLTQTNGQNGQENPEAFGSAPLHSPSQSLARKLKPDWPETWYCLEIPIICTEDDKVVPPTPHTWQVLIMEDMVWEGRTELTEATVAGLGWAVLYYRQQSLGERLSLGEARDATFTLSGIIAHVGKQTQLNAKPVILGEGRWLITQDITEGHSEPRGPDCPCSIPPTLMPFSFQNQELFPWSANLPVTAK